MSRASLATETPELAGRTPGEAPARPTFASVAPFVLLSFCAAAVGAAFEPGEWYAALRKPPYNPPDAVFAPVWTLLYLAMGIAAALVWRRSRAALPLALWLVQLALNAAWSWLFFGLHRIELAFFEIRLLWLAVFATTLVFWRIDWRAGALLVPYLLWVGFASLLNWELWRLNG